MIGSCWTWVVVVAVVEVAVFGWVQAESVGVWVVAAAVRVHGLLEEKKVLARFQ
jgi:hypothetical protein